LHQNDLSEKLDMACYLPTDGWGALEDVDAMTSGEKDDLISSWDTMARWLPW
jgi:hypothetical protein